jgi:hypothetical protein
MPYRIGTFRVKAEGRTSVEHHGCIKWLYCFPKPPSRPSLIIDIPATGILEMSHVLAPSFYQSQPGPLNSSGCGVRRCLIFLGVVQILI